MIFLSQKLAQTYYQSLEYATTAHCNCSFLHNLALKTKMSITTVLIQA